MNKVFIRISLTLFKQTAGDFKRKIIIILDQISPEYENVFSKVGILGEVSKTVLLVFPSPKEFNQVSAKVLAEELGLASRDRIGSAKAEALKSAVSILLVFVLPKRLLFFKCVR